MARTPRASVAKTSGQGVSRLAYQKAYRSTHGADTPKVDRVAKTGGKSSVIGDMNVSYGDTFEPTDLGDIKELGALKPAKASVSVKPAKAKVWK
jgi:hypothetical protein